MKLFSLAILAGVFCAVMAAPSSASHESMLLEVDDFGVVESINKAIQSLLQSIKCSISVVGQVVGETDFKTDYVEFKAAAEAILNVEVQKCAQAEGLPLKFQCALAASQKLFELTANFTQKVKKTNTELAEKIAESLKDQCFNQETSFSELSDDSYPLSIDVYQMQYGVIDTITKALQALVEKVTCSLGAIATLVVDSELLGTFEKFKNDVEKVLQVDVINCIQTGGILDKIKCAFNVSQKVTKLFATFSADVVKINTALGGKIISAIAKCMTS